jgi:hypothetical protein
MSPRLRIEEVTKSGGTVVLAIPFNNRATGDGFSTRNSTAITQQKPSRNA